jgi:hypothetical protein
MPTIEYLDPEIANEGQRADDAFVVSPKPHVWDYAPLKEHKHYGKYFAPKPFREWPAVIYNHKTGEEKTVGDAGAAARYGVSYNRDTRFPHYVCTGDWKDEPKSQKIDFKAAGKSLVTASAAQSTSDTMTEILKRLIESNTAPSSAMAEDKEYQDYLAFKRMQASAPKEVVVVAEPVIERSEPEEEFELSEGDQKEILVGLAKEKGIKADGRWSLDRLKAELDKHS